MRKRTGIIGMVSGAVLTAWNGIDALGNLQTAKQLIDNRNSIIHAAGLLISFWWFGPALTIASCTLLVWRARRHRDDQSSVPQQISSPIHFTVTHSTIREELQPAAPPLIDATPSDIANVYKRSTSAEANAIFRRLYEGKRIPLSGTVQDVNDFAHGVQLQLAEYSGNNPPHVLCTFDKVWESRLLPLQRGRSARLTGIPTRANQYEVMLDRCELIEVGGAPEPARANHQLSRSDSSDEAANAARQWLKPLTQQLRESYDEAAAKVAELGQAQARAIPDNVVNVEWDTQYGSLNPRVHNDSVNAIRDFRIFVTDMHWYSAEKKDFAEVREVHMNGPFKELELIGGSPQIFIGEPVVFPFLSKDRDVLYFQGRTQDASLSPIRLTRPGIWRVRFRLEALGGKTRHVFLFFQWEKGKAPIPCEDPRTPGISKAPPPIRPIF